MDKQTLTLKEIEEIKTVWFERGKKAGRAEVQRSIKDALNIPSCQCEK